MRHRTLSEIAESLFPECERRLGVSFRRKRLLLAALAHPSYRNERHCNPGLEDFERMEYFGDAVLTFLVSERLYNTFPEAKEGRLSHLRSALVSKKMLSRTAMRLGLASFIRLGKSEEKRPLAEKRKILADSLEAVIAAIFLDQGMGKTRSFVEEQFKGYLASRHLARMGRSPKNLLQEWVQRKYKILPVYRSELSHGRFTAWAVVARRGKASGEGLSKKEAEEKAARRLLTLLKKEEKT
jgi:ribonuclease-3